MNQKKKLSLDNPSNKSRNILFTQTYLLDYCDSQQKRTSKRKSTFCEITQEVFNHYFNFIWL